MKKSFYSFLFAAVLSLGSLCAYGAEATAQAIVLSINGSASASWAGQTTPVALKVGDKLPQGATIVTSPNAEVSIQTMNGAVALIQADSTVGLEKLSVTTSGGAVTKQTTLLNLKVGKIFSKIDPANHNINDYGIRTPKGVAAARGTEYTVSVTSDGKVVVYVTASTVAMYINGKPVDVHAGDIIIIDGDKVDGPRPPKDGEKTEYGEPKKYTGENSTTTTEKTIVDVSLDK